MVETMYTYNHRNKTLYEWATTNPGGNLHLPLDMLTFFFYFFILFAILMIFFSFSYQCVAGGSWPHLQVSLDTRTNIWSTDGDTCVHPALGTPQNHQKSHFNASLPYLFTALPKMRLPPAKILGCAETQPGPNHWIETGEIQCTGMTIH